MLEHPAVRWTIIGLSVAVSLAVLVWWAGQLGLLGTSGEDAAPEAAEAGEVLDGTVVPLEAATYAFGGAADPGSVRIEAALVIAEDADPEAIAVRRPLLDDAMLATLAEFEREDITGSAGSERLRDALLASARRTYPDIEVQQALITDLIVG